MKSKTELFSKELLRLLPIHRKKEKRSSKLTLDELIDDYRRLHDFSPSELDLLLMAYRYEYPFQFFLLSFTEKKIKPEELLDLWRLAFASLLTRREESLPQLTHAWVESSKKLFGEHTASLTNAFCRRVLREKNLLLDRCHSDPDFVLGPSLARRWENETALKLRFANRVLERPGPGISAMGPQGEFLLVHAQEFKAGEVLAMTYASHLWVKEIVRICCEIFLPEQPLQILDACAAPGGKLIASLNLLGRSPLRLGQIIATDSKFKRLQVLRENLVSWKWDSKVKCLLHDWTDTISTSPEELEKPFDVILADLPCTGLGTLPTRPDLLQKNWSDENRELRQLQEKILTSIQARLATRSILFVSVCSSDPSELQHLTSLLKTPPSFRAELIKDSSEEITGWVIIKSRSE